MGVAEFVGSGVLVAVCVGDDEGSGVDVVVVVNNTVGELDGVAVAVQGSGVSEAVVEIVGVGVFKIGAGSETVGEAVWVRKSMLVLATSSVFVKVGYISCSRTSERLRRFPADLAVTFGRPLKARRKIIIKGRKRYIDVIDFIA